MGKTYAQGVLQKNGLIYGIANEYDGGTEYLFIDYRKIKEPIEDAQRTVVTLLSKRLKEAGNKYGYATKKEAGGTGRIRKRVKKLVELIKK